jgi:glyoxylase-like metal-dependent hydrolase (beta-lactamase superfamily II)
MNPDERQLQYAFGDALPATGATLEVVPGVRWLRMPLPFALDHINLWLLRDRVDGVEGWTVVDCGVATEATRALWARVFEAELQGLPVLRVIVTHMHPDHLGLAHWLCERWSDAERECRLWISATDWNAGLTASRRDTFDGEGAARFYASHGLVDTGALAQVQARKDYFPTLVPAVPARFGRLMDGMVLHIGGRDWRCITGYGHAPEHISLHCPAIDTLISGDMVLPRISTNVSVFYLEPEGNPLPLYLRSIAALRALPAGTLVLPSHGKPFQGLHTRIAQLEKHHEDRLAEVMAACAQAPQSAADLLPVMFRRKLDLHQTTFAMGEAIAHLHALADEGRLAPALGSDGVRRFHATR